MTEASGFPLDSLFKQALAHHHAGEFTDAATFYGLAIDLKPDFVEALSNRGAVLHSLGRMEEAAECYRSAISFKPDFVDAYNNLGAVLGHMGRSDEAIAAFRAALDLNPTHADAHNNLGLALARAGRYDDAIASYRRTLEIDADHVEAQNNLGIALSHLENWGEAASWHRRALKLDPDGAITHYSLGVALLHLERPEEALECYRRAAEREPENAAVHHAIGVVSRDLQLLEESRISLDEALRLDDTLECLPGDAVSTSLHLCDWSSFEAHTKLLLEKIERGEMAATPFVLSTVTDSPQILRKAAELMISGHYPSMPASPARPKAHSHEKIRVGYFSSDFCNHPVASAMIGILERHDKARFETVAFSTGKYSTDEMRRRTMAAVDKFVDVRGQSNRDVVTQCDNLGIDIAVDLNGFTSGSRLGIFARRAAPIQVVYLGYAGTMGAEYFDYLIADRTVIPDRLREFYSESIVYLPGSSLPNSSTAPRANEARNRLRKDAGLPEEAFVFCCFNNNYKIVPDIFDAWMRILSSVPDSVLWLRGQNAVASANLRKNAAARGISPERLIFAQRVSEEEYLQRYAAADLFLDTWPYNAGSVGRECLGNGLPLLTLCGESFASRMAASSLEALALPELIASTREQYEAKAIELARNPAQLKKIAATLEQNRTRSAGFDMQTLTRNIEQGYEQMHSRHRAGLKPADLHVSGV